MQIHAGAACGNLNAVQRQLDRGVHVDTPTERDKETPLIIACDNAADVKMLRLLIDAGADPNARCETLSYTPLMRAANKGSVENVTCLLNAGANANYISPSGTNAVGMCFHSESPEALEIIRLLVDAGAGLDHISEYGDSPLRSAAQRGHSRKAKLLISLGADRSIVDLSDLGNAVLLGELEDVQQEIDRGADLDLVDGSGMTPWMMAVASGDLAKAQLLHKAGSSIEATGIYESPPLVLAAKKKASLDMCRWLVSIGCDLNQGNRLGETPLAAAASCGCEDTLKFFLISGASIRNQEGTDIITRATSTEIASLLVDAGSDIDTIDPCGESILMDATVLRDIVWVRGLLELGADPDANSTGETALHLAAKLGEHEIAKLLIRAGANVSQADVDGWTPLMYAATLETAQLLVDNGASTQPVDDISENVISKHIDPEIIDLLLSVTDDQAVASSGLGSLIRRSAEDNQLELVDFVLSRGANVDAATSWGESALLVAAEHHHLEMVRKLIRSDASLEQADENGRTALFYAAAPESLTAYELAKENKSQWLDKLEDLEAAGHALDSPEIQSLYKDAPYGYFPSDDPSVIELLVETGADLEATCDQGMTALLTACLCGRPAQAAALIRLGANRSHRTLAGESAVDCARQHQNARQSESILALLKEK